jgi:hypothetical protein
MLEQITLTITDARPHRFSAMQAAGSVADLGSSTLLPRVDRLLVRALNRLHKRSFEEIDGRGLRTDFRRLRSSLKVVVVCVRRYAADPLRFRSIEKMVAARGVVVDRTHTTAHRRAIKIWIMLSQRERHVDASCAWTRPTSWSTVSATACTARLTDSATRSTSYCFAHYDWAAARRILQRAKD